MSACPVCATPAVSQFRKTPYWTCPSCDCWFQSPLPPKVYHGSHESPPEQMSDGDKAANEALAGWLFDEVMNGKAGATLDIGAAYPYLASRLLARGCFAHAIDGEPIPDSLGVSFGVADFEQDDVPFLGGFNLITMVHVWEHVYRPVEAMRKLRGMVAADGRVFIRSPDHKVRGIDRDLTPGHFSIHPFVHTLSSILQCCVEAGDCFEVESYSQFEPGQMQVLLRPIKRAPTIAVGMIAKNESRDLPRAMASVASIADFLVVVDTGSTDNTKDIASAAGAMVSTFTDASIKNEAGDWLLQDFSRARNHALEIAEATGADWYMWMDADDELLTPANIRRAAYWTQYDVFGVQVESGGQRWTHHRLWKTGLGIIFEGRCHEYPTIGGHAALVLTDSVIRHDAAPGSGETANERNLRILIEEFAEKPSPRTAFYLANTHKDAQRYADAIPWYGRRIDFGPGYRDEWLFAYLFKARCERAAGEPTAAEKTLLEAASKERSWAELWMELAYLAYEQRRYGHAIGYAMQAADAAIPETQLWREPNKYTDQPPRLISWCYEHIGDNAKALEWAKVAREKIGQPDAEWDARIVQLSGAPAIIGKARDVICLRRAGAIGDVLMTLNLLPALKAANPESTIYYFTDSSLAADNALGWIIRAAGVDQVMRSDAFNAWHGHARSIDLVGYPLAEGYPDKPMKRHLLEYFAAEMGLTLNGELPALTLPRPSRSASAPIGEYITIQDRARWSKYKSWTRDWNEIKIAFPDVTFERIDESRGLTLRDSIALFANANAHIGVDSFCGHLSNYFWESQNVSNRVRALILWGSTQPAAAGYGSNINLCHQPPCGPCFKESDKISRMPRGPCVTPLRQSYDDDTPWRCMENISINEVIDATRQLLASTAKA